MGMAPMQKLNLKSIAQTSFVQRSGDTPPSKGSPSASQYMLNYDAQQQQTQPLQSQYQHRVGIMNYFKTQSSHHKLLGKKKKKTRAFLKKRIAQQLLFKNFEDSLIDKFVE